MLFSIRVIHSGSDPLGNDISPGHAFFTMTTHISGKEYKDLAIGETCIRQACTADGRQVIGGKTQWIRYSVGRVA